MSRFTDLYLQQFSIVSRPSQWEFNSEEAKMMSSYVNCSPASPLDAWTRGRTVSENRPWLVHRTHGCE
jgi:hypothetical protein